MLQMISGEPHIAEFAEDMIMSIPSTKPVFIFNPDETEYYEWTKLQTRSMMSASENDPIDAMVIKNRLGFLMEMGEVDSIFFLSFGQAYLIRSVVNDLELLKSKISVIIPFGDSVGLMSRLNSQLYLYEIQEDNINLFESYQIR